MKKTVEKGSIAELAQAIKKQYHERYPDMSETQVDSLVREFFMYDS